MNKNTKAMLTLLAATSITSVAGITSYANTKVIDTNVSAKEYNEAIEARIQEEARRVAAEQENAQAVEDTVEEVHTEAVAQETEAVAEVSEQEVAETEQASEEAVVAEEAVAEEAVAEEAVAEEAVAEEVQDVYVAEEVEAEVSSAFVFTNGSKVIDTDREGVIVSSSTAIVAAKGSSTISKAIANAVSNSTSNLPDAPDLTPAETYAAPIFSTGKIVISASSHHSIVTDSSSTSSSNVTTAVTTTEDAAAEEAQEEVAAQEAEAQAAVEAAVASNQEVRNRVAAYASSFANGVGKYRYGGTNPFTGADCSGFVQHVLAQAGGVSISRTSASQARQGAAVGSINQAKVGDLLFYAKGGRVNHVGIYLGNGKVISASSPSTGMRITAYNYRPVAAIRNVLGN